MTSASEATTAPMKARHEIASSMTKILLGSTMPVSSFGPTRFVGMMKSFLAAPRGIQFDDTRINFDLGSFDRRHPILCALETTEFFFFWMKPSLTRVFSHARRFVSVFL